MAAEHQLLAVEETSESDLTGRGLLKQKPVKTVEQGCAPELRMPACT